MKRKLLCALAALMLMCIAQSWALAGEEVTLSWTQAAATCAVSNAYYVTADGTQAFIAGGLTRIPVGAEVYVTLTPLEGETAIGNAYVVFDGGRTLLEPGRNGAFHFTMQTCKSGQAAIVAECGEMHAITYAPEFAESTADGFMLSSGGALRAQNISGDAIAQALSGDVVAIQVVPGETNALARDSLCAVMADGTRIAPERGESGIYSFVMPDEPVMLTADFTAAALVGVPDGVVCEISGDYAYQDPPRALPDSDVALTVQPADEDMRIRSGSQGVLFSDGDSAQYVDEQDDVTGAFSVSVAMPQGGISVLAEVGRLCRITAGSDVKLYAADKRREISACCAGDEIYAQVNIPDGYGLVDGRLNVSSNGGDISVVQHNRSDDESTAVISLIAPACDIYVEADIRPVHSIVSAQTHGLGIVRTYPAGSAVEGSTVTIALTPTEGWHARENSLEICAPGTRTVVAQAQSGTFVMPQSDCEISVEFEPEPCGVKLRESTCFALSADYALSVAGASGTSVSGSAPAGALVNVYATSLTDCTCAGIYMYDVQTGETQALANGCQAAFVMPAHDVEIYAVCADKSHSQLSYGSTEALPDAYTFPYEAEISTEERGLRLRKASATDAEVVGAYSSGTRVTVERLSDDGEWAYVRVADDGERGWMKAEYISPVAPEIDNSISITITLPDIRVHRPFAVEKTAAQDEGYVFKHIILL